MTDETKTPDSNEDAAGIPDPTTLPAVQNCKADIINLFTGKGESGLPMVVELIAKVKDVVKSVTLDATDKKGRKAIGSLARRISSAKVIVDTAGKEAVADLKAKTAAVDAGRKMWRDTMDAMRDEILKPRDDWEAEQQRLLDEQKAQQQYDEDWQEADEYDVMWEREAKLRRREEEVAERERKAREAEEEARRQAEEAEAEKRRQAEAQENARQRKEREEQIAREAAERAKAEAQEEQRRQAEQERLDQEAREADEKHRKQVESELEESIKAKGFTDDEVERIMDCLVDGAFTHVTIQY